MYQNKTLTYKMSQPAIEKTARMCSQNRIADASFSACPCRLATAPTKATKPTRGVRIFSCTHYFTISETLRSRILDHVIWDNLPVMIILIIVTKMCLLNMNFFSLSVIDSATTDLNLMEHHPCPLCGVSHLAHPNRLNV